MSTTFLLIHTIPIGKGHGCDITIVDIIGFLRREAIIEIEEFLFEGQLGIILNFMP